MGNDVIIDSFRIFEIGGSGNNLGVGDGPDGLRLGVLGKRGGGGMGGGKSFNLPGNSDGGLGGRGKIVVGKPIAVGIGGDVFWPGAKIGKNYPLTASVGGDGDFDKTRRGLLVGNFVGKMKVKKLIVAKGNEDFVVFGWSERNETGDDSFLASLSDGGEGDWAKLVGDGYFETI